MLTVIKKDLRIVAFEVEKIKTSIISSADDINFTMNQVDIDMIANDVEKRILRMRGKDGITSCYEIRCIVIKELLGLTFRKLANSYYSYCAN